MVQKEDVKRKKTKRISQWSHDVIPILSPFYRTSFLGDATDATKIRDLPGAPASTSEGWRTIRDQPCASVEKYGSRSFGRFHILYIHTNHIYIIYLKLSILVHTIHTHFYSYYYYIIIVVILIILHYIILNIILILYIILNIILYIILYIIYYIIYYILYYIIYYIILYYILYCILYYVLYYILYYIMLCYIILYHYYIILYYIIIYYIIS